MKKEMDDHCKVQPDVAEMRREMNRHFDSIDRLIIRGGWMLFGTMVIGFLTLVLSLFLTQH